MQRTLFVPAVCALLLGLGAAPGLGAQEVRQQIVVGSGGEGGPLQMLPPGRQPKTGTGRLRGRIVAADTGSAVRRAQVRITGPDIGSQAALTDGQGRYEFKDLPAGRFNLNVSKSGFVSMQYGQNRPFEPGRPIDLADAQVMDKADVALPRGSVLSGRVSDEFGEPVAEANVVAMRMQYTSGKRRLVPSGRNGMTNDLGQFRLYGLPPGEYYVSATLRSMDMMVMDLMGAGNAGGPTGSNQNAGYAATYYPGTPSPAEAQRVAVAVGQEVSTVDIALQPVRLAKISGMAVGSDGKPMAGAMVMLMPSMKDAMQFMPGGTSRTNKDGQFTLSGVAPGEYSLQAQSLAGMMSAASEAMTVFAVSSDRPSTPQGSAQEREFAVATVSVAGEDLSGVVVTGTRGAKASGRITFTGGAVPDGVSTIRLMAGPTDNENMGPALAAFGNSSVKDDGTFTMDGLVGGRMFRVLNGPKEWFLHRVTVNGEDITDKGMEFKPGEDVSDILVEMTNKTTAITGTVTDEKGQTLKDCTVVVFAEDQQKWTLPGSRWARSARPDQDGHFKFSNLPPGAYYAIAVEYVASGEWGDPEWLARASRKAARFTLDEGAAKALDLKLSGS
jgi:protocatechuate 3,4-dioxygenase beta subunit